MVIAAWVNVALVVSVIISWLAIALALWNLYHYRQQASFAQQRYEQLKLELQAANSGAIGMGQKLLSLERKMKDSISQQQALSKRQTTVNQNFDNLSYSHAASLLTSGLKVEDVARSCGLSRAEASLVNMMQRRKASMVIE